MNKFYLVVSATVAALNNDYIFNTKAEAKAKRVELVKGFVADGYVADADDTDTLWKGENLLCLDIDEVDEDEEPVLSEHEQGWANVRADERAAVQRQNREDAEYAAQQGRAVYYHGVRGSLEPDGGYIFEP